MVNFDEKVLKKIGAYSPEKGLDDISRFFIHIASVNHVSKKEHSERVALHAEKVAKRLYKDQKATFFAGLLHDVAVVILPYALFDGHDITKEEYEEIKKHAHYGFDMLKESNLFTALCVGLHHAMYDAGYGLTIKDLPLFLSVKTLKKVFEIATIVSVCDFIDSNRTRTTKILDGSDASGGDLRTMLLKKYPDDRNVIDAALRK